MTEPSTTTTAIPKSYPGSCRCKQITYTLTGPPMFVNACHCTDCQALSGSAFAINAMIEATNVHVTSSIQPTRNPSGLTVCSHCGTNLWGSIEQFGDAVLFVRVGTLESGWREEVFEPDAHFYMRSKFKWVVVPEGLERYEALPGPGEGGWSEEVKGRLEACLGRKVV